MDTQSVKLTFIDKNGKSHDSEEKLNLEMTVIDLKDHILKKYKLPKDTKIKTFEWREPPYVAHYPYEHPFDLDKNPRIADVMTNVYEIVLSV